MSLKELKVMKSPKHSPKISAIRLLPRDTLTGLDLGVEEGELGVLFLLEEIYNVQRVDQ
jgi:hypothetical protein